jgi:CheY-like chemotaxis protein
LNNRGPRLNEELLRAAASAFPPVLADSGARQLQAWEDEGGAAALAAESVRILIVDNDMSCADALELMLHASGYANTRVAYSGHAALAIAAEFAPAIVLLELNLLDMNGYALAKLLREHAQRQGLRVIALTSSREHAGREQARVAGCERYLLKPVAALDLIELLKMPR